MRKRVINSQKEKDELRDLLSRGYTPMMAAIHFGIQPCTIYYHIARLNLKKKRSFTVFEDKKYADQLVALRLKRWTIKELAKHFDVPMSAVRYKLKLSGIRIRNSSKLRGALPSGPTCKSCGLLITSKFSCPKCIDKKV